METPMAVANYFIRKSFDSGKELTPMKLVKLVYIAHGWHLALTEEPLINEAVQAWKYGPVVESVYHKVKQYGDSQITKLVTVADGPRQVNCTVDAGKEDFLNKIWEVYSDMNGLQLSTLTHQSGTPWDIVWNKNGGKQKPFTIIPNDLIQSHYKERINVANPR